MAFSTDYGFSKEFFGGADYAAALFPHKRDTGKLKETRNRVLDWLLENPQFLAEPHKPGKEGGLYERIKNPSLHTRWGDSTLPGRSDYFGGADLDASRAAGFSDEQIRTWLDVNPHVLREDKKPGSGGLYDWLTGDAVDDRPDDLADWTANITYAETPYIPKASNTPTVTRDASNYTTYEGMTINRPDRTSLKINPNNEMIPKNTRSLKAPKRKKYEQTSDLTRQARQSLNIS